MDGGSVMYEWLSCPAFSSRMTLPYSPKREDAISYSGKQVVTTDASLLTFPQEKRQVISIRVNAKIKNRFIIYIQKFRYKQYNIFFASRQEI